MAKILDRIFGILTLVRRLTCHSGSLQKNRLIALERAAAADAEYEFADGSSSPANAIIVGVGLGQDPSLPRSIRVALRFTPRSDGNSARAHLAARDTAADCRDGLP
jgi:hypothetical protein